MKNIKKIVIFGIMMVSFTSCNKFIEEQNLSNADAETYYNTAAGFQALVNANYAAMKGIYGNDAYIFEAGTDLCADGSGRAVEPLGISQYTTLNPASDGGISGGSADLYPKCYSAIQEANMAIFYSTTTQQTSNIGQLVGEVKYLRAAAYFELVQQFGGVAIVTNYITDPVLKFDRASANDVYNLIISDLTAALGSVSTAAYTGKVNQRAVQHLLAKVYLTRAYETFGTAADFTTAATYAEAAIAGQALSITPANLWKPGNEMNAETIFSVQYSTAANAFAPSTQGNKQASFYGPYLGGPEVAGKAPWRSYTLLPTAYFLGLFTQQDLRYQAMFMTKCYATYYDGFNATPTTVVKHYYAPQWASSATDLTAAQLAYPSATIHAWGTYAAGVVSSDYQTIPVKKFDDPTAPYAQSSNGSVGGPSTRDIILSRLGETYLIAAEAYLSSNPALGLARLNAVRARAGLAALTSYTIQDVLDERARELFGEYHRWEDLKRTGKLVQQATLYNYLIPNASQFNGSGGVQKILRPIPQTALDLNQNKSFPQNPAYQ